MVEEDGYRERNGRIKGFGQTEKMRKKGDCGGRDKGKVFLKHRISSGIILAL